MAIRQVYFDHNATTPLHPEVIATLTDAMQEFGNPSSMHAFGRAARQRVETARELVASFMGCGIVAQSQVASPEHLAVAPDLCQCLSATLAPRRTE